MRLTDQKWTPEINHIVWTWKVNDYIQNDYIHGSIRNLQIDRNFLQSGPTRLTLRGVVSGMETSHGIMHGMGPM